MIPVVFTIALIVLPAGSTPSSCTMRLGLVPVKVSGGTVTANGTSVAADRSTGFDVVEGAEKSSKPLTAEVNTVVAFGA